PTAIATLSLHDALPISLGPEHGAMRPDTVSEIDGADYPSLAEVDDSHCPSVRARQTDSGVTIDWDESSLTIRGRGDFVPGHTARSEEHTSELQSRGHLV